jgi:hypothetical protein
MPLADHHRLIRPPAVVMQIHADFLPPLVENGLHILSHTALHLVRQHDHILNEQIPKLRLVIYTVAVFVPYRHALPWNGIDMSGLYNLTFLATELDDVAVHVREIPCPVAKESLAEGEDLAPVEVIVLATEEDTVNVIRVVLLETGLLKNELYDEVSSDVVGMGIGLVLVSGLGTVAHAALNVERDGGGLPDHALTGANWALVLDGLSATAALIALHLHLLEHAWGELMANNLDAVALARGASVDVAVGGTGPIALLANMLLIPLEFGRAPVVEVSERDGNLDVSIVAASLLLAEVATTTEETVEDVKGVVVSAAALLLVLLQTLMAILVVDATAICVTESFVRLRNLDELVVRSLVSPVYPCQNDAPVVPCFG